jgi:predicted regulator of amino acid metabolism with ACT domain
VWDLLTTYFQRFPAQSRVAQTMLQLGLSVRSDGVYAGPVAIPDTSLARACGVDRRIIASTVETIRREPELRKVYERLTPTVHLKDAAPGLRWGVLEIVPTDARRPGILAHVATIVARRNISIRQAIVDDPVLTEEPRLWIVTESPIPFDVIAEIKAAPSVKSVVIY